MSYRDGKSSVLLAFVGEKILERRIFSEVCICGFDKTKVGVLNVEMDPFKLDNLAKEMSFGEKERSKEDIRNLILAIMFEKIEKELKGVPF